MFQDAIQNFIKGVYFQNMEAYPPFNAPFKSYNVNVKTIIFYRNTHVTVNKKYAIS